MADAAVIDIAAALDLEERGQAKILLNFGDPQSPPSRNQVIFASDQLIRDRPEGRARLSCRGWFETIVYCQAAQARDSGLRERSARRGARAVADKVLRSADAPRGSSPPTA